MAGVDPHQDCFELNPNALENRNLHKIAFLGCLIGWALINVCVLSLDFPPALWKRIVHKDASYVYSLDELG